MAFKKLKYDGSDEDMNKVNEKNGKFLSWIQTFTKGIVSVFSILYVIIIIVMVYMLWSQMKLNGYADALPTMISEINETFRIVIGGYLVKAALENSFKITGSFLQNINKKKLEAKYGSKCDDSDEPMSPDYNGELIDV